jgi:hypothetical protein
MALPESTRDKIRDLVAAHHRKKPSDGAKLLLVILTPLPETQLASPSEMMDWLGEAAAQGKDGTSYVLGKLRDAARSQDSRAGRESSYMEAHNEERASALERVLSFEEWQHLTEQERQWAMDALDAPSRADLMELWTLSIEGVKSRLRRLGEKIKEIKKL